MSYQERTCCCCIPLKAACIIILILSVLELVGGLWNAAAYSWHIANWFATLALIAPVATLSIVLCCKQDDEKARKNNYYCWLIYAIVSIFVMMI